MTGIDDHRDATARPRLLYLTRRPPWPLTNGSRIRSFRLLEGLSQAFDIVWLTMLGPAGSTDDETVAAEVQRALPTVRMRTVPGPGGSVRSEQVRSLAARDSWKFGRYATDELRQAIAEELATGDIDVVHAEELGVALALPSGISALTVHGSHNIEYRIVDGDRRSGTSLPRRLFSTIEYWKSLREERRVWSDVDLTLAVSPLDAETVTEYLEREGAGASSGRVMVSPNGTDPTSPEPRRTLTGGDTIRLLFVGSAAYAPYERGLAWFVGQVWPQLQAQWPVVLDVVGERPNRPIEAPGVTYRGYVDSVDDWYDQADAVVVPVFEGSGSRLKLVEAANRRRPIIATALGAEGLPLVPEVHYQQVAEPGDFAPALARLVDDRPAIDSMVDEAATALESLLWPRIAADLVAEYRQRLAARSAAAEPGPVG